MSLLDLKEHYGLGRTKSKRGPNGHGKATRGHELHLHERRDRVWRYGHGEMSS